ncbi:MAG: enoyl-CoA hydratase/isomerase family protein [Flavobacteriales bacterium]|nr:enoyl-CoA hydratase/isomerase family protein [Flavobacteriales bacterium]
MIDPIEQGGVNTSIINNIATIEFHHPLSNSLPRAILKKLAETISKMGKQKEVSVIVLKSAGEKAFCAGASFDELIRISSPEEGKIFFNGFAQVINAARVCPKIIIGRVQGKAVGGGVGIVAATDYCFATKTADVKLSELSIGIGPFVIGPVIERKIGLTNTSYLTLNSSEWKSAEWAKEKGLYAEIYDNVSQMDEAVESLATKLSKSNPDSLTALKKIFWEGTENWDDLLSKRAEISGALVLSKFTQKALKNFKK